MKTPLAFVASALDKGAAWVARRGRARSVDLSGDVVLITGGSRGLGLCLAREYAQRGAKLVLLARSAEELERARFDLESQGAEVVAIPCDVADELDVAEAFRRALARFGRIDVVVNNAGDIAVAPLAAMRRDDFKRAMDTNFWGTLNVVLAALPTMRARQRGRIVNIASVGGLVAVPHLLPYSASKFAVTGLSYGLRAELAKSGIVVTTVCPGLLRTGSPVKALFKGDRSAEFAWFGISDSLPIVSMHAARAARAIVEASCAGRARLILTPQAKVAAWGQAIAPEIAAAVLARIDRWLPASTAPGEARGSESSSAAWPSWVAEIADRAATANNETEPGVPAMAAPA